MHNKRGADLSAFIPFFIAAVIVAVIFIIGSVKGWDNFLPWLFKGNNVDNVVRDCSVACTTENIYGFCTEQRVLKATDLPGGVKSVTNTCNYFATETGYETYNIEKCLSFSCEAANEEEPEAGE